LKRPESLIHAAADASVGKISVAVRYAFAVGRKALRAKKDAVQAVHDALLDVLPGTLLKVAAAGGRATRIPEVRTASELVELRVKGGLLHFRFDSSNPRAAKWAKRHAAELAKDISETTRQAIADAIAEQQEEGGDVDILAAVGDETRADLIARTESMRAANFGQREAWAQAVDAGLLTGDEQRTWIATGDEALCPICEALDGATAGLDGEYPDPGGEGPPAHPRCRCTEGIAA